MEWEHASDQSGRYDAVETSVTLLAATSKQVVTADPDAVFLSFFNLTGQVMFVSTKSPASTSSGIAIGSNLQSPNVELNFDWWGPFVQKDWFAFSTPGGQITVFQLFLRRGPRKHVADFWGDSNATENGIKSAAGSSPDLVDRMARAIAATTGHYFERASDQSLLGSIRRSSRTRPGNYNAAGDEPFETSL